MNHKLINIRKGDDMKSTESRLHLVSYVLFGLAIGILVIAFFFIPTQSRAASLTLPKDTTIEVCFSPKGGCTETVIQTIGKAKHEILVQAYSFTSAPIAKALVDAKKRGVKVYAILDKSQRGEKYTSATFLVNSGVPTSIDDRHAIAHNKIMILDGETIITGSFNFTRAAEERNAENLLVIRNKELARFYIKNWSEHENHSKPYNR
jgi:phosphatidylserine/phosphatidylglycerophosphate/cardiolipin synthase-like enzyme